MRRPPSTALLAALTVVVCAEEGSAFAQSSHHNYVELRGAVTRNGLYRYAEFSRAFRNKAVLDVLYIGNPGQNEFYGGLGYQLSATPSLAVTPLLYGVIGKENGERGVALGAFVSGTAGQWSVYSFLGHFRPIEGSVPAYTFLDSFDVSRKVQAWEFGLSTGFFYLDETWNPQVGPVAIRNDHAGAWRFYIRGGTNFEGRLGRTFSF